MQIEYFTKQKPSTIQSNGKLAVADSLKRHLQLTEEDFFLSRFESKFEWFSFDIIIAISFYLIAYMNTNECESVLYRLTKHKKKNGALMVFGMNRRAPNVYHYYRVQPRHKIRLQWKEENKKQTREEKSQIHFSFFEIEKNWIILFTAVFFRRWFFRWMPTEQRKEGKKNNRNAEKESVFFGKKSCCFIHQIEGWVKIVGLCHAYTHSSVCFVFFPRSKSKSKMKLLSGMCVLDWAAQPFNTTDTLFFCLLAIIKMKISTSNNDSNTHRIVRCRHSHSSSAVVSNRLQNA